MYFFVYTERKSGRRQKTKWYSVILISCRRFAARSPKGGIGQAAEEQRDKKTESGKGVSQETKKPQRTGKNKKTRCFEHQVFLDDIIKIS